MAFKPNLKIKAKTATEKEIETRRENLKATIMPLYVDFLALSKENTDYLSNYPLNVDEFLTYEELQWHKSIVNQIEEKKGLSFGRVMADCGKFKDEEERKKAEGMIDYIDQFYNYRNYTPENLSRDIGDLVNKMRILTAAKLINLKAVDDYNNKPSEDKLKEILAVVEKLESKIDPSKTVAAGEVFEDVLEEILNPSKVNRSFKTHFTDIDKLTSGLKPGELIIIGGRPGMGKSALAWQILRNTCVISDNVGIFFSLEMSKEQLIRRDIASIAGVSLQDQFNNNITREQRECMKEELDLIKTKGLYIEEGSALTVDQIKARSLRVKRRHSGRLDVIVVDYLQLMSSHEKNRYEQISSISRNLKALAKDLGVCVIALSQLSRKNEERSDPRPILSDLRESGQIEQDADLVGFVHRDEYYQSGTFTGLLVRKHRNGGLADVELEFDANRVRFDNHSMMPVDFCIQGPARKANESILISKIFDVDDE